jgi:ceramide glucosyltransferase
VVGKSMLLRRSELEKLGGLRTMADVMAEDYVLGQRYHGAGLGVVLSAHPVYTQNRAWDVARFASRHMRWAQLRRWGGLSTFIAELLMYPVPWLVLSLGLNALSNGARALVAYALLGIAWKALADAALFWHVRGARPPSSVLAVVPLRDCLLLGLWCVALLRRTVVWRGNRRRIGRGTSLLPVASSLEGRQANSQAF